MLLLKLTRSSYFTSAFTLNSQPRRRSVRSHNVVLFEVSARFEYLYMYIFWPDSVIIRDLTGKKRLVIQCLSDFFFLYALCPWLIKFPQKAKKIVARILTDEKIDWLKIIAVNYRCKFWSKKKAYKNRACTGFYFHVFRHNTNQSKEYQRLNTKASFRDLYSKLCRFQLSGIEMMILFTFYLHFFFVNIVHI